MTNTDEIVRLQKIQDAFRRAADLAQQYCQTHGVGTAGDNVFQVLCDDAERHRNILAKLREPSEAVWEAAVEAFEASSGSTFASLCAAVEAAEQEVGNAK